MATIAVLGTGLLGAGFVENLLEKGHTVRVWNRSAAKLAPLVAKGAVQAADPAEAARGADRVHLVLAEDGAVEDVLRALRPGLGDGVPVIDHSTNLPERVALRVARLADAGVRYLHAPVFMGPSNASSATGLMLVSGDADLIASVRDDLASMTGKLLEMGPDPARAATAKITGNGLLVLLLASMGDLFTVAEAGGMSKAEVMELLKEFAPSPRGIGQRVIEAGTKPATFELAMARKDVRLMIETAGEDALIALPAVAAAMDRAIAEGHGSADYTRFVQ